MKALFIGNSFSEDLTSYLQSIAEGELYVRNLMIGGCSLEMHAHNVERDLANYDLQIDASSVRKVSIREMLESDEWDVVSIQQVSGLSGCIDTYEPYISTLISFIKEKCPNAKIVFHRTWAYDGDSQHHEFGRYDNNTQTMHERIVEATSQIAQKYGLETINSAEAIRRARELEEFSENGGFRITRDGFHLSLTYGRYLIGLGAYSFLTRKDARGVKFYPDGCDENIVKKLQNIVASIYE